MYSVKLKFVSLSICVLTILTVISYNSFANASIDQSVGVIGVSEEVPVDQPSDNIFHVNVEDEICGDEKVWLVYEVYGLREVSAVSRSINDDLANGGYMGAFSEGWRSMSERVDLSSIREGENVIRFGVPSGAEYSYKVRNVSLQIEDAQEQRELVISKSIFTKEGLYLNGFVSGAASDPISVTMDGEPIQLHNKEFEFIEQFSSESQQYVVVEVTFSDGEQLCQELQRTNQSVDFLLPIESKNIKAVKPFEVGQSGRLEFAGASLNLSDSALQESATLSITPLRSVDIPPMDPGMINVTKGYSAYRMLPHGIQFQDKVQVAMDFDPCLIPDGYTENDIRTFFFDENTHHWVALPKDTVLTASATVLSWTTHFTDMINGVIQVPESPEVAAHNSTSMKGIKAANPMAGINLMQPPSANNSGNASISYPLHIPAGRAGMQPQLAVTYNNAGGNGWLGLGWDLTVPTVTIDTRWGVPRYDAEYETETYALNGQQLTPVAHRGDLLPRENGLKRFYPRVEGAFQKIERHGDINSYYWIVTDKSGTQYYYGGNSVDGYDESSVLLASTKEDTVKKIAQWALREVRDLNGNFIKYHYSKTKDEEENNLQIYIDRITYTGFGQAEGSYQVAFDRTGDERLDVQIDARLGFKRVSADLLRKVEVMFNEEIVRHYEFKYTEGAFFKTLLQSIDEYDSEGELFYSHTLEYYDDVRVGEDYVPFSDEWLKWDTHSDDVTEGNINIEDINDKASALSASDTKSQSNGMSGTMGPIDGGYIHKMNTAGGNFEFGYSKSRGRVQMIDINGDGLPDKVMMITKDDLSLDTEMKYRPQLLGEDGEVTYGEPVTLLNAKEFLKEQTYSFNAGVESNMSHNVSANLGLSKSVTSIYFSDVNGDGLPDIVKKGVVYFNSLNEDGIPRFTKESRDTPNVLSPAAKVDAGIIDQEVIDQELEDLIDQNPLHDVVRMWQAPMNGQISIFAPVQLLEDTSAERKEYKHADGVVAKIQLNANELKSLEIGPEDYNLTTFNLSEYQVKKGDRLYFRLQSVRDGAYDQVHWDPVITYKDHADSISDANNKPVYQFQASRDYVVASPQKAGAPIDGRVKIESYFVKPITTDDVTVEIIRGEDEILYSNVFAWNEEASDSILWNEDVQKGDEISFKVSSATNVDWSAIEWFPRMYYTESYDSNIPYVEHDGRYLIDMKSVPDFNIMADVRKNSFAWRSSADDTLMIKPRLDSFDVKGQKEFIFTVKKKNELVSKHKYVVRDTTVLYALSQMDTMNLAIPVRKGEELFVEFHTLDRDFATQLESREVLLWSVDETAAIDTLAAGVYTLLDEELAVFGKMYRNWGQFVYNGNRERANEKIDESELRNLRETMEQRPSEMDFDGAVLVEDVYGDFDAQGGYKTNEAKVVVMLPSAFEKSWVGSDEYTYIQGGVMSSSRMGVDDLESMLSVPDFEDGASAIDKIMKGTTQAVSFSNGLGVTKTWSQNKMVTDYLDMNGDRYPDILSESKIQYTQATGGLEEKARSYGWKYNHRSTAEAKGVNISNGGTAQIAQVASMSPESAFYAAMTNAPSLSGGYTESTDHTEFSWIDMNGDGLPDRVYQSGKINLNQGYGFLDEKLKWINDTDNYNIRTGESRNSSASVGFNLWNRSIMGGVGYSRSENFTKGVLQDVNGDGLPDCVTVKGNDVMVLFNLGGAFANEEVQWTTIDKISKGVTNTMSINVAWTVSFQIWFFKFSINHRVGTNYGFNRQEIQLSDIDGDGFVDYLQSDIDSELNVRKSNIRRTNMLKTVHRPLGASFTLDYQAVGNTYDHPSSVWTLKEVAVFDGFAGDGVDTLRTSYGYEEGYYDRREREFYGFGKVKTQTLTEEGEVYSKVTQTFKNRNYYEKGLLESEVMTDAEDNKYVVKTNSYELKDIFTGDDLVLDSLTLDRGNAFPALVESTQQFYEGEDSPGKETHTSFEYDKNGNVTKFTDFGDEDAADDLIATIQYHQVEEKHLLSMPKSIEVKGGDGQTYRTREADINPANGTVKQMRQYLDQETAAVYDMEYDAYGNLTKLTRPENKSGQRMAISYTYDTDVHTYTTEVSNSYGYTSSASYDFSYGQMLSSIDMNEQEISYELDSKGRVVSITGPYEQKGAPYTLKMEYVLEEGVPHAITSHYDTQNKGNDMQTVTFVDGLGRVIQTKKDGAIYQGDGQADKEMMIVSGRVYFDALGRATQAYYPVLNEEDLGAFVGNPDGEAEASTTVYDVMNRAISVTLPDGAETKTTYGFGSDREGTRQFMVRTTDANNVVTEQFTDVRGRVTAVKNQMTEGAVWTSFAYNAINEQIAATNDLGHTTVSSYDALGRRTSRVHPDAGTTQYKYDLTGNLTELITANLQDEGGAIKYEYDYERLTDILYPVNTENDVHYTYGAAGAEYNRAGRIVLQEDASGVQEFFYGPQGEVVKNVRTIVLPTFNEQSYVTEWTYDSWNRLISMIYPDGEEVKYNYNVGGLLSSMSGNKQGRKYSYVQQLGYDKFEQRVFMAYGNGSKMTYSYEADRRRLQHMTATTGAKRLFMDNHYHYDAVNNILALENKAIVDKPAFMGGSSEYSYQYDELYRLTEATGHYTGANEEHRYQLQMSYNTVGGITQKTQSHDKAGGQDWSAQHKTSYDMTYEYSNPDQPNTATRIGQQSFSYDANGNQTGWRDDVSGQERRILWDEENRIRAINDGGNINHYIYDASGERVIKGKSTGQAVYVDGKLASASGSVGNYTVYVNPYMVLQNNGYTKHFYIEGQRIVSKIGGGNSETPDPAGTEVNYSAKREEMEQAIVKNLKWLGDDGMVLTAGKSGKIPPGQVKGPGNVAENQQYYYHPDHLGSTSYITDITGEVYQHLEYFAFGETFVEEHSNTHKTPYKFNAKELDEETGLYYYGARYYDPFISQWLGVDQKSDEFPEWSPFVHSFNNPVIYVDPDGNKPFWASQKSFYIHQRANLELTSDLFGVGVGLLRSARVRLSSEDKQRKKEALRFVKILDNATVYSDGKDFQTGETSFRHAMRNKGETVEQAKNKADDFVRGQFDKAWQLKSEGKDEAALFEFGVALHTLQDATSPEHGAFQEWSGEENIFEVLDHVTGELFYPGKESNLQKITERAWEWYKQGELPKENLFNDIEIDE